MPPQVSIWYGAVLRGDLNAIRVGSFSNIQDKTIIHAARCVQSPCARWQTMHPMRSSHLLILPLYFPAKSSNCMQQAVSSFQGIALRVVHACRTSPTGLMAATVIGRYCTVGQGCLLRSATIENECIVGDRSILLEGSLMENHSVLAPGSVLPPGRLVPAGQLWAGNPARFVRDLTKDEARGPPAPAWHGLLSSMPDSVH